jgi:PKD repeat protein
MIIGIAPAQAWSLQITNKDNSADYPPVAEFDQPYSITVQWVQDFQSIWGMIILTARECVEIEDLPSMGNGPHSYRITTSFFLPKEENVRAKVVVMQAWGEGENDFASDRYEWTVKVTSPRYEVQFFTNPPFLGEIRFGGNSYSHGERDFFPLGTYWIEAYIYGSTREFDRWTFTGGISVEDCYSKSTKATVTGSGSLTANWKQGASNPPELTLFQPEIDGLTVKVNGVTRPGTPGTTITRIHWDWGDGFREDGWFPASHTYAMAGTYTVTVTAYQSDDLSTTRSLTVTLQPQAPREAWLWIFVKDSQTQAPIAGATVYFDGELMPQTDYEGKSRCTYRVVNPPEIHSWRVEKSGYKMEEGNVRIDNFESGGAFTVYLEKEVPQGIPPELTLFTPEIDGLTVSINGVTMPGTPGTRIDRIHWDWGDGFSEDHWFPDSHTYSQAGTYTITVTSYQSDGLSTTKSVTVTVSSVPPPPSFDFRVSATPSSRTIKQGESTTFDVVVEIVSGSPETVSLSLSGLPSGTSYSFSQNSGYPTFTSTLTITTSTSTPVGTFTLTIAGEGDGIGRSTDVALIVQEKPSVAGNLLVRVFDSETRQPIQGVGVHVDGSYRGDTDFNGALLVSNLDEGYHLVALRKESYKDKIIENVLVEGGRTQEVEVYMEPGEYRGKVKVIAVVIDQYDEPVDGAEVYIDDGGGMKRVWDPFPKSTDKDGKVEFSVDAGSYIIEFRKKGYKVTQLDETKFYAPIVKSKVLMPRGFAVRIKVIGRYWAFWPPFSIRHYCDTFRVNDAPYPIGLSADDTWPFSSAEWWPNWKYELIIPGYGRGEAPYWWVGGWYLDYPEKGIPLSFDVETFSLGLGEEEKGPSWSFSVDPFNNPKVGRYGVEITFKLTSKYDWTETWKPLNSPPAEIDWSAQR